MTEGEFRDWVRGYLSGLEGRLGAVEARPIAETLRSEERARMAKGLVKMAEELLREVRAGRVEDLAIVYFGKEGLRDGWSVSGRDGHLRLIGALQELNDDLLNPDREAA